MSSTQTNFFDSNYVFDYDAGLNFAIAFTDTDKETENILDPSYGNISFMRYAWGNDDEGNYYEVVEEIESHQCTKEELGIEGDNSSFMPISENTMSQVKLY